MKAVQGRRVGYRHRRGAAGRDRRPSIGTVVSQKELQSLPLNGRQFANLAVLAPGTTLGYNTDPTKPGQLVVALNGGSGPQRQLRHGRRRQHRRHDRRRAAELQPRGGAGVQDPDDAVQGRVRPLLGRRAHRRHEDRHQRVPGSVCGVLRARTPELEDREREARRQPESRRYDRKQYGASFGGPIVKDKVHFFATYEKTKRDQNYVVDTGGHRPGARRHDRSRSRSQDELATAKVTWDIDAKQYLQVRYGYQKNDTTSTAQGRSPPRRTSGTVTNKYSSILAGYTAQISADMLNEFVFQYTKFNNAITADSQDPLLYYPSGFAIGQNINTPQTHQPGEVPVQGRLQLLEDDRGQVARLQGRPHVHQRADARRRLLLRLDRPVLDDRGPSGGSPSSSATSRSTAASSATRRRRKQYSAYFQDDWRATPEPDAQPRPALRLLRRPHLDQRSNPIWQALSTQTTYNESYLKDFQGRRRAGHQERQERLGAAPRLLAGTSRATGATSCAAASAASTTSPTPTPRSSSRRWPCSRTTASSTSTPTRTGSGTPTGRFFQPGQPLPPNQLRRRARHAARTRSPRRPSSRRTPTRSRSATRGRSTTGSGFNFEAVAHAATATSRSASAPTSIDPTTRRAAASRSSAASASGTAAAGPTTRAQPRRPRPRREVRAAGLLHLLPRRPATCSAAPTSSASPGSSTSPTCRAVRDQSVNPLQPAVRRLLRAARHRRQAPRDARRDLPLPGGVRGLRHASATARRCRTPCGRFATTGDDHGSTCRPACPTSTASAATTSPSSTCGSQGLHLREATSASRCSPRCSTCSTRRTRRLYTAARAADRVRRRPAPGRAAPRPARASVPLLRPGVKQ